MEKTWGIEKIREQCYRYDYDNGRLPSSIVMSHNFLLRNCMGYLVYNNEAEIFLYGMKVIICNELKINEFIIGEITEV